MNDSDFSYLRDLVLQRLDSLDENLTYHCKNHTEDVMVQCLRIAEDEHVTAAKDLFHLKFAALYHDTGFLQTYFDHEKKGCEIFLRDVKGMDFQHEDLDQITRLIMVTKIPQQPQSLLERVICDADLDYLGRDDFFDIADNLRKEFLHFNVVKDDHHWHELQLHFLTHHHYHTSSSQNLREPVKQEFVKQLRNR